jgi:hypothetical protein
MNVGNDVSSIDQELLISRHPQCNVQYGTILRYIDPITAKHGIDPIAKLSLLCQLKQ